MHKQNHETQLALLTYLLYFFLSFFVQDTSAQSPRKQRAGHAGREDKQNATYNFIEYSMEYDMEHSITFDTIP